MAENDQIAKNQEKNGVVVDIITGALKIPGVKVDRSSFLNETFKSKDAETKERIIAEGPVAAGVSREELKKLATLLVNKRTLESSSASFLSGLPGGLAIAATIPADVLQFYGFSLRLSQEIAYLYGAEDMWADSLLDENKVANTFILYLGVMLGASGAQAALKVAAKALAEQVAKKLPAKALTKTLYYPIIKSIARWLGISMTKQSFGKAVAKVIPVFGGLFSGTVTYASMRPMGNRLIAVLDRINFEPYTEKDLEADLKVIQDVLASEPKETPADAQSVKQPSPATADYVERFRQAKALLDAGLITEEEYARKRANLVDDL